MNFLSLALTVLLAAVGYRGYLSLEENLESFFIFNPDQLKQISSAALEQHGNNTEAVVSHIVASLQQIDSVKDHINLEQEWVFNNAGGAMGAMYIIHASKFRISAFLNLPQLIFSITRHNRIPHNLRHRPRHRRPHGPAHGRRLLLHPQRRRARLRAGAIRARSLSRRLRAPPAPRRRQAVQDGERMFRARVCEGLDPAHVAVWVCGYVFEYV